MPVILNQPNVGIPGALSRLSNAIVEPVPLDATSPVANYGDVAVIDATSHAARAVASGDTAASAYGIAVRPYPGGTTSASSTFGPDAVTGPMVDVLRQGYITVQNKVGTPALNGKVYVRVVAASPKAIGDIEATADSTNNVAINAHFTGAADANGNVEISFGI